MTKLTPEKVLDLSVKFGVVPFLFYQTIKQDGEIAELQAKVYECYEDRLQSAGNTPDNVFDERIFSAILPDKLKIVRNGNS